jgi:ribonuclease D
MRLIKTTDELSEFCGELSGEPFITVDTEFMRERTYYPLLCLIQVASRDTAAIIDPLAEGIDLAPLYRVFADGEILKVFHAARQDLEIMYHLTGEVPYPLFDTQIAAMACGFGDQIGYEPLIRELTGEQVDKGSRFTDWSRRPLSEKQLTYALGDVTHLVPAYEALKAKLAETGRENWVAEEMQQLNDPDLYVVAPETAWQRLKLRNVRPKELGILMKLTAWREREAQRRNIPRSRILKDDAIYEIARAAPKTAEDLGALRAIPSGFERSRNAAGLLDAVKEGLSLDRKSLPDVGGTEPRRSAPVDVLELLRVLLKTQSEYYKVAPKLLASAADLEAIALSDDADVPAMRGWRREVFGGVALKLKHGEVALGLKGRRVTLIER